MNGGLMSPNDASALKHIIFVCGLHFKSPPEDVCPSPKKIPQSPSLKLEWCAWGHFGDDVTDLQIVLGLEEAKIIGRDGSRWGASGRGREGKGGEGDPEARAWWVNGGRWWS